MWKARNANLHRARNLELEGRPSPDWAAGKLEAVGCVRSTTCGITNYVMLELGQPLHAFDAAKLQGDIRCAMAVKRRFMALDGAATLTPRQIVIADEQKALAIGLVMAVSQAA